MTFHCYPYNFYSRPEPIRFLLIAASGRVLRQYRSRASAQRAQKRHQDCYIKVVGGTC